MYNIGIDVGGTNIAAGIVNENNEIIIKGSVKTLAKRPTDEVISDMASLCKDLMAKKSIKIDEIFGVGIAFPGTINTKTGIVEYSNNIRMDNYPLSEKFSSLFGIDKEKVVIGNDANIAALGEHVAGAGKGADSSVMITLGTGVGGGIVIDGKVLTGFAYGGAEVGHMVIVENGRPCTCGRNGCFEAYSSATALIKSAVEKMKTTSGTLLHTLSGNDLSKVDARLVFDAYSKNDAAATEVVNEYISYLACGVTNLINIFQPNVFIIGGGVSGAGKYFLDPLKEIVKKQVYSKSEINYTKIVIATLGNDAAIVGGSAFVNSLLK